MSINDVFNFYPLNKAISVENYDKIIVSEDFDSLKEKNRLVVLIIVFSYRYEVNNFSDCMNQWYKSSNTVEKICLCGKKALCTKFGNSYNGNIIFICADCKLKITNPKTIMSPTFGKQKKFVCGCEFDDFRYISSNCGEKHKNCKQCKFCKSRIFDYELICETCVNKNDEIKEKKNIEEQIKKLQEQLIIRENEISQKNKIKKYNTFAKQNYCLIKKIEGSFYNLFQKNKNSVENYKSFLKYQNIFDENFINDMDRKFRSEEFLNKNDYIENKHCNHCFEHNIPKILNIKTCNDCLNKIQEQILRDDGGK